MLSPLALLLILTSIDEYRRSVQSSLRADALPVAVGVLAAAIGVVALGFYALRKRTSDRAFLWFGLFALFYGFRLCISASSVQFATGLDGRLWTYVSAAITYFIPVPIALFLFELVPNWHKVLRWIVAFQLIFGFAGSMCDVALRRPFSLTSVNNVLVLLGFVLLSVVLFRPGRQLIEAPSLRIGIVAFFLAAALGNLRGLGLLPLPFDPEPIGFAIFLLTLAQVLTRRAVTDHDRLTSIDNELDIARRIQQSILPREIPETGVSVNARYLPMTAVAGDFYDFLVIDRNRLGILIADVSGHGVPAALIASMVKVAIAAQAPHADDPARVMAGMNQILCGKLQGQFVTAAYLYLDLAERRVRYAAAGHPAAILVGRRSARIESITENGLPLGIIAAAAYTATERALTEATRFVLYTDGLLEASNEKGEFFGEDGLRVSLASAPNTAARHCAEHLLAALGEWAGYDRGRPQDDDLTLIVVDIPAQEAIEHSAPTGRSNTAVY